MRGRLPRLMYAATIAAALVATVAATSEHSGAAAPMPALRSISSRVDGALSTVMIEASEPVAYLTSQPDPLTVLVDLRNVTGDGLADRRIDGMQTPVSMVDVETAAAPDGSPVTRIRLQLERAATYRVRSSRNVIYVEIDRNVGAPGVAALGVAAATAMPLVVPPAATGLALAAQAQTPAPITTLLPSPSQIPDGTTQRFTGHAVTFDFQGADLRAVLRTFADISGLNVVIDPTIQGTVDVSLREVPWDQALDIILKANKLGYTVEGTIVRIAPLAVLSSETDERRKLAEAVALSGELRVLTRALSYAKAQDLVTIITSSALSTRGEVQVDPRTNTLILRDLADRLTAADDLISVLDKPQPQVEIEARIVTTTRNNARQLGVQWGAGGRLDPALGNGTNLTFPSSVAVGGRLGDTSSAVNLPAPTPSSALGIALGSINGALNLDLALSALEESGKGRVLSTPRVSTQNNVEAEMTQGVQIPIQTVANNTITVSFKDAALTLRVTPQITASDTVIMRISIENAQPDYSRQVNGIPPIDTQRAVTSVLVADGQTTVLGGIYVSREQATEGRTPLLHRIPLLGWLFKRDVSSDESRELLIFITPRIAKG